MNAKQKLKHFKLQNKNVTKTNLNEYPPILFPWMKFFSYIKCALPNDSLFLFYNLELKKNPSACLNWFRKQHVSVNTKLLQQTYNCLVNYRVTILVNITN